MSVSFKIEPLCFPTFYKTDIKFALSNLLLLVI